MLSLINNILKLNFLHGQKTQRYASTFNFFYHTRRFFHRSIPIFVIDIDNNKLLNK